MAINKAEDREYLKINKNTIDAILSIIKSIITEIIIAFVIYIIVGEGTKIFWYVLISMNAFLFIYSVLSQLIAYIFYKLYFKRRNIDLIITQLEQCNFPPVYSKSDKIDAFDHYYDVLLDSDQSIPVLLKAKEFGIIRANSGLIASFLLEEVHKIALYEYSKNSKLIAPNYASYYE